MSVLIKGNDMPNCCYYCPISDYSEDYDEWYCSLVNSNVTEYDTRRHQDCPLADVPTPHGRLIDADNIYTSLDGYLDFTEKQAPTIIEAEREET